MHLRTQYFNFNFNFFTKSTSFEAISPSSSLLDSSRTFCWKWIFFFSTYGLWWFISGFEISTFLSESSSSEDSDRFKSGLWCKIVERNCPNFFVSSVDFGFFKVPFLAKFSLLIFASLAAGLGFFGVGTSVGIFFWLFETVSDFVFGFGFFRTFLLRISSSSSTSIWSESISELKKKEKHFCQTMRTTTYFICRRIT